MSHKNTNKQNMVNFRSTARNTISEVSFIMITDLLIYTLLNLYQTFSNMRVYSVYER